MQAGATGSGSFWSQVPDEQAAVLSWERTWEQSILQACLAQVRQEVEPQTYQAFELVVQRERPPADAALKLGVPIKLVYNAKHRVLKRVRELRAEYDHVGAEP